jgi:hypothetical protein
MLYYKSDDKIQREVGEPIMEPATTGHEAVGDEELLVHNWRVTRLTRLGVPGSLAEVYADRLDWHQVARLVQRGCPPRLALRIAS